jgi:hypothetical protein
MMELALLVGGGAIVALCLLELYLAEEDGQEDEEPRWLDYVSGPYVMTKRLRQKERNW